MNTATLEAVGTIKAIKIFKKENWSLATGYFQIRNADDKCLLNQKFIVRDQAIVEMLEKLELQENSVLNEVAIKGNLESDFDRRPQSIVDTKSNGVRYNNPNQVLVTSLVLPLA